MGTQVLKALVVDDHPSIRKVVAEALIKGGFDVIGEAGDGAQALEIGARLRPDVVTLDVSMPGMDGLTALPQLRKTLPGAVIVMLSMHTQYEKHARHGGADAYILKTRAADELIPAICSACEGPGALFSERRNEVSLAGLQARVKTARDHYAALRREAGEATELLRDIHDQTPPTADGTFAAAKSAQLDKAVRAAMHEYFDALAELKRSRERPARESETKVP
jgi:two-component system chemotaxis response regulator CheY